MSSIIKLSELKPGEKAAIRRLGNETALQKRLTELGFYPGSVVKALFQAVCGDPTAYLMQNAVIALRRPDAEKIDVIRL